MKSTLVSLILLASTLVALCDSPGSAQNSKVAEIADRMKAAADPNGAYKKSYSYSQKQKLEAGGNTYIMETVYKVPAMSKTETTINDKLINTLIYNDGKAWSIDPDGEKTEIGGGELLALTVMNKMQSPDASLCKIFEKITIKEGKLGQNDCFILECEAGGPDIYKMDFYVDKKDYLTKKMVTSRNGSPYVAEIKKYSLLQGVLLASETSVEYNGSKSLIYLMDYKLNIDIPDSKFKP